MVPDSALAIGPVVPNCRPDYDVVFLSRTDTEGKHNKTGIVPLLTSLNVTVYKRDWFDWQNEQPTAARTLPTASEDLPSFRLQVANNMLCRGRVVLSDRLHASILALLMGRPFVGLDNFYGKVRNVHEIIFNRDDVDVIPDNVSQQYMVRSEHEAVDVILRLLGRNIPQN
jgi:exopolysaccharide biosynthesis predicted pyruvyltransferase EpsI